VELDEGLEGEAPLKPSETQPLQVSCFLRLRVGCSRVDLGWKVVGGQGEGGGGRGGGAVAGLPMLQTP